MHGAAAVKIKHAALAALATIVVGLALYLVIAAHRGATAVSLPRLRFEVGERASYQVNWQVKTGAGMAPAQVSGVPSSLAFTSKLTGTVDVETLAVAGDEATLAVSFAQLDDFSFEMHGRDAIRDRAATVEALRGKRAFVTINTRGVISAIAFDATTEPGTRNALRGLVMQMQLSLPGEASDSWQADEAVAVGRMQFVYSGDGSRISRAPRALVALDAAPGSLDGRQSVRGSAAFALAEGKLATIEDRETWSYTRSGATAPVVAHDSVFVMKKVASTRFDVSTVTRPTLPGRPLEETVADASQEQRLDAALAREMTREKLIRGLEHFDAGQKAPHDYVARAGAFLRLHPEAARVLVGQFARKDMSLRGRGMILDILANAGDANAQSTMRELLITREAHESRTGFGLLVQRFTFVDQPDATSVAFLENLLRDSRTTDLPGAQGAAASLGAVANRLARSGDTTRAAEASALIAEELASVTNPDHMRALIAGLGNAGDGKHVRILEEVAHHDDPRVRAEVAGALGSIRTEAARKLLVELAVDPDATVGVLVFSSLGHHELRDAEWNKLADVAKAHRTATSADASFVDLVRKQRDSAGAHGIEILQALQMRNAGPDNDLAQVIAQLLARK
jgi:hypothetical protein